MRSLAACSAKPHQPPDLQRDCRQKKAGRIRPALFVFAASDGSAAIGQNNPLLATVGGRQRAVRAVKVGILECQADIAQQVKVQPEIPLTAQIVTGPPGGKVMMDGADLPGAPSPQAVSQPQWTHERSELP
jgi:hypothetical protein